MPNKKKSLMGMVQENRDSREAMIDKIDAAVAKGQMPEAAADILKVNLASSSLKTSKQLDELNGVQDMKISRPGREIVREALLLVQETNELRAAITNTPSGSKPSGNSKDTNVQVPTAKAHERSAAITAFYKPIELDDAEPQKTSTLPSRMMGTMTQPKAAAPAAVEHRPAPVAPKNDQRPNI